MALIFQYFIQILKFYTLHHPMVQLGSTEASDTIESEASNEYAANARDIEFHHLGLDRCHQ